MAEKSSIDVADRAVSSLLAFKVTVSPTAMSFSEWSNDTERYPIGFFLSKNVAFKNTPSLPTDGAAQHPEIYG